PSPRPACPWQTRQYVSYRKRPRLIDSDVRVRAFTRRSAVWMLSTGSAPVTGTVPGMGGIGWAYGLMLRRCRMVENQPTRCTTSSGLQPRAARAPYRIVISNMMTTYGGIEPIGLPPSTSGQSYDMYSVSQAPMAQPAIPPIKVNIRTGLTG